MTLTERLKELLYGQGAALVGIADMSAVESCEFRTGVSIAIPLPKNVIIDLQDAPTKEYYNLYYELNNKLNEIIMAGEEFLLNEGFDAYGQTTSRVKPDKNNISKLPHKTVATRAGLGWIGKNCLLVTPQYGSAIRLSSLLTNAPLEYDKPMTQSLCGSCGVCVQNCPAQALNGKLWEVGTPREEIVNTEKCYKKQVEIMLEKTGIKTDLCGKCFAVCAYTQKYLQSKNS